MERLKAAKNKTVGTKQTLKALEKGVVKILYIAQDAESHVLKPILKLAEEKAVEVVKVESMALLGRSCDIKVGSASAAVLAD